MDPEKSKRETGKLAEKVIFELIGSPAMRLPKAGSEDNRCGFQWERSVKNFNFGQK